MHRFPLWRISFTLHHHNSIASLCQCVCDTNGYLHRIVVRSVPLLLGDIVFPPLQIQHFDRPSELQIIVFIFWFPMKFVRAGAKKCAVASVRLSLCCFRVERLAHCGSHSQSPTVLGNPCVLTLAKPTWFHLSSLDWPSWLSYFLYS